ncbi:hypothetical protein M942_22550 [Enterobacter ludwigii]|uniref:hypothetical protein n=1 Tax=Enterobacter ludwigii TaxID=299767 RepID=UPI0003D8B5E3|nr:hypothetical protein [Enterobacter ludwigii]AHE73399.1 hypothetical protein M942_22550 [Enterobacter ludwigii]
MRYYDIQVFYPTAYPPPENDPRKIFRRYSSQINGVNNPGALMIELDIQRFGESTPKGESRVSIWGVSPQEMQQARQNMFGMTIEVYAGMSPGLPLATLGNNGLVMRGVVWQVVGNWQGTELRMDLIVTAGPVSDTDPSPLAPVNLTLPWQKGRKLSDSLFDCFRMLGGGYKFSISVSDMLVNNHDDLLYCGRLCDLAGYINMWSKNLIRDSYYSGVEISMVNGNEIRVFDNDFDNHSDKDAQERKANPKKLRFSDLAGQPAWVKFGTVSVVCVMRADIQVGDYILMPDKSSPMVQASSYSQFRDNSAFEGLFLVSSVRLLGNSRHPDGNSWVTVLEAHPDTEKPKS